MNCDQGKLSTDGKIKIVYIDILCVIDSNQSLILLLLVLSAGL